MINLNAETRSMIAIANDIYADKAGRCTISIRGMANLLGVSQTAVQKRLDLEGVLPVTTSDRFEAPQKGTQHGFEGDNLKRDFGADRTVDDAAFHKLIFWYAVTSPRGRTQEAKDLLELTSTIGVRGWMQAEAGHDGTVQELVQSVKIDRSFAEINQAETIDRLNALVLQKDAEALTLRANIKKGYVGATYNGHYGPAPWDVAVPEREVQPDRIPEIEARLQFAGMYETPTDEDILGWVKVAKENRRRASEARDHVEHRLEILENLILKGKKKQGCFLRTDEERLQTLEESWFSASELKRKQRQNIRESVEQRLQALENDRICQVEAPTASLEDRIIALENAARTTDTAR